MVEEKILFVLQDKLWKKQCNMPTETVEAKKREFRSLMDTTYQRWCERMKVLPILQFIKWS